MTGRAYDDANIFSLFVVSSRGQVTKRSTGSASMTLAHLMQQLKSRPEITDGRRHSVSLPVKPHQHDEPAEPTERLRRLSDPLWGRFQPAGSTWLAPQKAAWPT